MGRRCKICADPNRAEIERVLIGSTCAKVAQEFGVGESNLYRHRKNCMAVAIAVAQEARGRDLKQELLKLSSHAARLAAKAEKSGQIHAAISAVRELARLLAMEACFYPQAIEGKISVSQIQAMILDYNRSKSESNEPDDEAIEVESRSIADEPDEEKN